MTFRKNTKVLLKLFTGWGKYTYGRLGSIDQLNNYEVSQHEPTDTRTIRSESLFNKINEKNTKDFYSFWCFLFPYRHLKSNINNYLGQIIANN